jgi:dipeptidyl-peptidase-4
MDPVTVLAAPQNVIFIDSIVFGSTIQLYGNRTNMRKLILLALGLAFCDAALWAQRKPVTLESLHEFRARAREVPGDPVWAPDGKSFVFRQGKKLMLYDIPANRSKEIFSLEALDSAAMKPMEMGKNGWENRRVREAAIQWFPAGRELLYLGFGDLFIIDTKDGNWRQITKTPEAEHDPKVSPDGAQVAFERSWDLYTIEVKSGKERRVTTGGSETLRNGVPDWVYPEELELGTAYWWSPDSRSLAYMQFDTSAVAAYPQIDLTGTRAISEPQRYPQAGEKNSLVRLGVVSAEGEATTWLETGDTANQYLLARAGWTPDSTSVYAVRLNRIQNELEFLIFDTSTGKVSTVYRETDPYWINIVGEPVFLKRSRQFIWSSERDGNRHLYVYSLEGGAPKQITRGDWQVVSIAGVNEEGGCVYFVSSRRSPLERRLTEIKLDGTGEKDLTPEPGSHRISLAPGFKYFLDVHSSLTSTPEASIRNIEGKQVAVHRPADRRAMEEFQLLPTEIISFKGPSGVTLYASMIRPANFDPSKKYPAIVNVYGGPHVQTVRNAWPGLTVDQVYAHRGYVVWQLDNRGSSGRGRAFEAAIFRRLGGAELEDQVAGVRHLISLGFVDPQRIGVTGWSYGGFMTLNLLLNAPDMFRAGFAGAPVTNWLNYDTIYTERYMGLPKDNGTGYGSTALTAKAGNLKGALMIVHNIEDDNVLFQNTLQMASALQNAGKQFQLMLYPQKSHGVAGSAARHMDQAMLDFFEQHLRPGAPR